MAPLLPSVPPSGATRQARAEMPTVPEEPPEMVDAQLADILYTSYTSPTVNYLQTGDFGQASSLTYTSCIDALSATVQLSDLSEAPKSEKALPNVFDMSLPVPANIDEAKASPNWDVPDGYKHATEKECGAWVHHEVLRNATSVPG